MECDLLRSTYERIVELVRSSVNPESSWLDLLEVVGQRTNRSLADLDFDSDIASITQQLRDIFRANPVPAKVSFLWFGLFDRVLDGKETEGYYVAGMEGTNPDASDEPIYLPKGCYLSSRVLNSIKTEIKRIETSAKDEKLPAEYDVVNYAVMLGAACLLTRFATQFVSVRLPIYVGYDSGDWVLVPNSQN